MNRELKFRAWDDIRKEWLLGYGDHQMGFSITGECVAFGEWENVVCSMVNGYFGERGEGLIIQQYTGLKDKNGRDIYEGDIVTGKFEDAQTGFQKKLYSGIIHWHYSYFAIGEYKLFIMDDETLKVIGNIFENPELIES
jgi:uncharacterized phage protein (TIGR01671 family)